MCKICVIGVANILYNNDYTNCKLIIRDETTEELIAETKVIEYNKKQLSIFVDGRDFVDKLNCKLSLLLLSDNFLHAYGGIARKSYSPRRVEISMFQGKEKEDRYSKRYPANFPAEATNIFFTNDQEAGPERISVNVLNLSTSGVLIEANADELDIGATFNLKLNIAGSPTTINSVVVRSQICEGEKTKYGCKFVALT